MKILQKYKKINLLGNKLHNKYIMKGEKQCH
jgi:hypothetical protein